MTRTQAWRTVAEAFGTLPERRTERQRGFVLSGGFGLCYAINELDPDGNIYGQMANLGDAMGCAGYWWPLLPEHDGERALFAGLMAAMTQRERDMLEPGL